MKLFLKTLSGNIVEVEVDPGSFPSSLKKKLFKEYNLPIDLQKLIHAGRELKDGISFSKSGVSQDDTVYILITDEGDLPLEDPFTHPPIMGNQDLIKETSEEETVHPDKMQEDIEDGKQEKKGKKTSQQKEEEIEEKSEKKQEISEDDSIMDSSLPQDVKQRSLTSSPPTMEETYEKVQIFQDGKPLAIKKKILQFASSDEPSTFQRFKKTKNELELTGFRDISTQKFLFSSPPLQALFHGKFGGKYVYSAYKKFSFGEEFVVDDEGYIQCYRNKRYWTVKNHKIRITKKKNKASKFDIRTIS